MGKYDKWILLIAAMLVGFGALMIYSTTSVLTPSLARKQVTEFYYFKRHIFTIIVGLVFLLLTYFKLKPSLIEKMAVPLLILSFVLLVCVFLPVIGVTAGGARRWIRLWPSTFQPSEMVKLAMVIFLAAKVIQVSLSVALK